MATKQNEVDKKYIAALIANGDKRSYNEIMADLQLTRWTAKMKHPQEYAKAKAEAEISDSGLHREGPSTGMW
jgi:hypothetical protein